MPDSLRVVLAGYLEECARRTPAFRWTPALNLHLTIRFLGHVELALAEGIADRLASAGLRGFELRLGGLGSFRRGRLVRVVWIGMSSGSDAMAELATQVETECRRAGLEGEQRQFHGHLTLARATGRDGAPAPELGPLPVLDAWRAGELILFRSRLGRGGSVYEPIRTVKLS